MIFERNKQNATKGSYSYIAKHFILLQPKRAAFGHGVIREVAYYG